MHTRLSRRVGVAVGAALVVSTLLSGPTFGQATTTPEAGTPAAASPTAVATTTPVVVTATPTAQPAATATPTPAPAPAIAHDERYFTQTGFRIDNDTVWDYFLRRGAVNTFGYPVSRTFQFRGVQAQFFQRRIVEIGPDGKARHANLLDPELMPYTQINGAVFPPPDPAVTGAAPPPTDAPATLAFVQRMAPDQFNGRAVNFFHTFANTVPFQVAFPTGGDRNLLLGIELEMWGVPTSNPAADPSNVNFVYQRFQRGVMHYRADCNCTEAILLADYLKAIITGQNLPGDLDAQAQSSPFYKQYDPTKPNWVRDPSKLSATDLTNAFTAG